MDSKIAIIDYGVGNITSVANSLNQISISNKIISNPYELDDYTHMILPGVGSFKSGMNGLKSGGWCDIIKNEVLVKKKRLLGICLGMQLLFDMGFENGETEGLGLISGVVNKMIVKTERLPHLGWNDLEICDENFIFSSLPNHPDFYFAHSYHVLPEDKSSIIAYVNHGGKIVSVITKENIYGTQFHPEKSQENGMTLLSNFSNI